MEPMATLKYVSMFAMASFLFAPVANSQAPQPTQTTGSEQHSTQCCFRRTKAERPR
jgi:hypothetical protein